MTKKRCLKWRSSAILTWRHISAVGASIWTKFGSLIQNNVQISGKWSKSKVDFQYGGRLLFKNGSSYISAINWDMSTKLSTEYWAAAAAILIKRYDVQIEAILFLVSHLLISLPSEGQSLWANQISSTYLNWWLRYNYFRFWKTNVRHIGNLLSVSHQFTRIFRICNWCCR